MEIKIQKNTNEIKKIFNLKYLIYLKFIIIIFFICFLVLLFNLKIQIRQNKICLCTPGKKENLYIREFIEHYKNFGINKIFLYDNNEIEGERFEDIINDYINNGLVKIINYRGKKRALLEMMNDCYRKTYLYYDWILFFEVDEYIHLKNYSNISLFLNNKVFNKCQSIQLNWVMHTDNNFLYYENKKLKERFSETEITSKGSNIKQYKAIKSILRGHLPNIKIECVHKLNGDLKSCDGFGRPTYIKGISTNNPDFEYYYIDHYFCKSTEEFINKVNKGDVLFYKDNIIERIRTYFQYNTITQKKIDLLENKLNINLSDFRNKIEII